MQPLDESGAVEGSSEGVVCWSQVSCCACPAPVELWWRPRVQGGAGHAGGELPGPVWWQVARTRSRHRAEMPREDRQRHLAVGRQQRQRCPLAGPLAERLRGRRGRGQDLWRRSESFATHARAQGLNLQVQLLICFS